MSDPNELLRPQYNSTLKLVKQIEDIKAKECVLKVSEEEIERIHEKASVKLNHQNQNVFQGLVAVEPNEEEFLKYLDKKYRQKVKPQINLNKPHTQKVPDIMEFYTNDLFKEYPEVEIENFKATKIQTINTSNNIISNPIENYFKWN